jgi:hypothetical protein
MKTLKELTQERDALIAASAQFQNDDEQKKKARTRVEYLNEIIPYLEKEPRQEFVEKMLEEAERKTQVLDGGFMLWCDNHPEYKNLPPAEVTTLFEKEMNYKQIKKHIKNLRFILANTHHVAIYKGKEVVIDFAKDKKEEFKIACMRIFDNNADGIVICPDGKKYQIIKGSKKAKRIAA